MKNIGTLSKKFKMPEITDKERAEAAVVVEMQKVRVGITDFWKRLVVSCEVTKALTSCDYHVTIGCATFHCPAEIHRVTSEKFCVWFHLLPCGGELGHVTCHVIVM